MATNLLTAAQARHVFATLRHVDDLLVRALRPLNGPDAGMLAAVHNDFSAEQAAALRTAIAAVRTELDADVQALQLPASTQPVSARWAASTAVRLALIALAELDGKHLSHYGSVSDAAAEQIQHIRRRLEARLEAVRTALEPD